MPELPEVETIRRQLAEIIVGKTIAEIEVLEPNMFSGDAKIIIGQKIIGVGRVAKVLRILLDNGAAILAHFKLNGQFFYRASGDNSEARFVRVIFYFADGSRLLFCDSRKFGWIKIVKDFREEESGAIEPFCKNFTLENFADVLSKPRRAVKLVLMDQAKVGGIGNIYANEALFAARVDPFRPANSLKPEETKRLYEAILRILEKAIECKGSSGKDEWYRQLDGSSGRYQEHFLVYQREGQKCPDCGGKILRQNQAGRGTFHCPSCQR